MTQTDHDIRVSTAQLANSYTGTATGQHFAIGVDATDPAHAAGAATLLEGAGGLWHACGDPFDAAALTDLGDLLKLAVPELGRFGKHQNHKGEHGYAFRSATATLPATIAPMTQEALAAKFQHVVANRRFAMVCGARGPDDRHILVTLLVERGGMMRPLVRFGSEWVDDLAAVTGSLPD
ncbi:hypothetical protein N825_12460 [Skermanella stibiiresistens SB22]|uniref:Uncharacterized protein n=1 Tax=Skermanella stibiiresistens SB22 TaxID=1385369 RepID=W9H1P8_9PROT|nr:hypothetical protein [Skermanella stibiiresistens]EWY38617.1 hypothetical protein N825_12460 [Skermanella stibiiresistens SB22]